MAQLLHRGDIRVFFLLILAAIPTLAQNNVGVGTVSPDPTAVLDVTSTNKGMLVPRLTTLQRLNINNPAT